MSRLFFISILLTTVITGCASTTVRKNPGPDDRGIRYYRPKPYLLIQPAEVTTGETTDRSDRFVSISLDWLPDYSEEYSIHIHAGLGWNNTSVTLDKGWNLTEINVHVDSQTDENLGAVAQLASAIPKGAAPPPNPGKRWCLKANNVPFGYYEAVISPDNHGVKRLYGWRYVGFFPYAACPVESSGVECTNCQAGNVFALAMENGAMTFRPIGELSGKDPVIVKCESENAKREVPAK